MKTLASPPRASFPSFFIIGANRRVIVKKDWEIPSYLAALDIQKDGDLDVIAHFDSYGNHGNGSEVEVKLPGRFKVSPQIAGAIKAVSGVVTVEAL